jgi:hypothetical protein
MTLLLLAFCLQGSPEYSLDREKISLNDVIDTGGRLYIRAERLQAPLRLIWCTTQDKLSLGVYRDQFGGALFSLGNGKDAVFHSRSLFFSLPALEERLGVSITRKGVRTTLTSKGKKAPSPKGRELVPGDRMVDLELPLLKNLDRKESLTKKRRGKRILLFFWAPWDSSRDQILPWQDLYRRLRRYDFVVIGITLDAAGPRRSEQYLSRKVTFPVYLDTAWTSLRVLGGDPLPSWALIDERGFLRSVGQDPSDAERAARNLEKEKGGKIVAWIPQEDLTWPVLPGSRWEAISKASLLWEEGKAEDGIDVLRQYLKRNENDRFLRFQKWSVQFPDRMHGQTLDPAWRKAQEKKERTGG